MEVFDNRADQDEDTTSSEEQVEVGMESSRLRKAKGKVNPPSNSGPSKELKRWSRIRLRTVPKANMLKSKKL